MAYIRIHRYHEAAAEFEFILESAPANDYAHYCLGRCLERLGDTSTALGHYKLAVLLRPSVDYYQQAVDKLSEELVPGTNYSPRAAESIQIVTGPSLVSVTCMSAPNRPHSTRLPAPAARARMRPPAALRGRVGRRR